MPARRPVALAPLLLVAVIAAGPLAAEPLTAQFEPFLGAETAKIVAGLQDGTAITLPAGDPGSPGATVVIAAPFGAMGDVNLARSLRIAREQLAQHGIQQPTGAQLHAALLGGEIRGKTGESVRLDGVLTLRNQNLGWGEVARRSGVSIERILEGDPLYGN